jgi:hypothetical protein
MAIPAIHPSSLPFRIILTDTQGRHFLLDTLFSTNTAPLNHSNSLSNWVWKSLKYLGDSAKEYPLYAYDRLRSEVVLAVFQSLWNRDLRAFDKLQADLGKNLMQYFFEIQVKNGFEAVAKACDTPIIIAKFEETQLYIGTKYPRVYRVLNSSTFKTCVKIAKDKVITKTAEKINLKFLQLFQKSASHPAVFCNKNP